MATWSLRRLLRQATAAAHQGVESASPFLSKNLDKKEYVRWMSHLRPLWQTMEEVVKGQDKQLMAHNIPWSGQMRLSRLDQDLHCLGPTSQALGQPHHDLLRLVHKPGDMMWACGVLYVMGGSRAGGALLTKHLKKQFNFATDTGLSFWSQADALPSNSFARLMAAFDLHIKTDAQRDIMIAAARTAFYVWQRWFALASTSL